MFKVREKEEMLVLCPKKPDWPEAGPIEARWYFTGLKYGEGSVGVINQFMDDCDKWVVVRAVCENDRYRGSRIGAAHFKSGEVVCSGPLDVCSAFIRARRPHAAILGQVAEAGEGGAVACGDCSVVTALKDESSAVAGRLSVAMSGELGVSVTRHSGISIADSYGVAVSRECGTSETSTDGVSISGENGVATSGEDGRSIVGRQGHAISGVHGVSVAGYDGMAVSGDYGVSIALNGGKAASGIGGTIQIKHKDAWVFGRVGDDIDPNTLYYVDGGGCLQKHKFFLTDKDRDDIAALIEKRKEEERTIEGAK